MDFLPKLGQQLGKIWTDLSPGRRLGIVMIVLIVGATVAAVSYWAAQVEYGVLFAGLAPEDAGAITSKLQSQGVPFRITGGGTTVMVPVDQVHQRRIELAVDGMPMKGGKGFELFDSSTLGMTPFTQHVNYLRAVQSELARTISQMDPVVQARVHIVRPDPTPFIRDQKPTTASVMLRLRPGATLNRNSANAIVAFVSRSVEGLTPEQVTLVDANGRLLSDASSAEGGSIATHLEYRKELETYLASKAETMLAQVLGPGKALVRVTADINFQHSREKKETYSPDGRVATSEMITSSRSTAAAGGAKGATGAASNNSKASGSGPGGSGNSQDETIKTDFVVSKVTHEVDDKVGAIERLTIAAMIDLSPSETFKGGAGSSSFTLNDAQEIIKQAVGFKSSRDEIKVTNVKLAPPVAMPSGDGDGEQPYNWQNIISLVRNGSLALAAVVAFVLGWMVIRRMRPVSQETPAAETQAAEAAPMAGPRLLSVLEQNPDAVAKVLSDWLEQSGRDRRAAA